MRDKKKTLE